MLFLLGLVLGIISGVVLMYFFPEIVTFIKAKVEAVV